MSEDPPPDDDIPALIDFMRNAPEGWQARASDDDDPIALDLRKRRFVFAFLQQLPGEMLWAWIDGMWLGRTTSAELDLLVTAIRETPRDASGPRRIGRPEVNELLPTVPPLLNASVRFEWRVLSRAFKDFARARRQHHAPMNRTRRGAPRSLEHRVACLETPMGQRVEQAGLFAEFFDAPHLLPAEMAAMLLHREVQQRLTQFAHASRANAASAPTDESRDFYLAQAAQAESDLKRLPAWRTLFDKLRKNRRTLTS